MSYRKYPYGEKKMNEHGAYLRRVGAVGVFRDKGPGPKAPPIHTAKASKASNSGRAGRNKLKCQRYREQGRREANKARRIERDRKRAVRA